MDTFKKCLASVFCLLATVGFSPKNNAQDIEIEPGIVQSKSKSNKLLYLKHLTESQSDDRIEVKHNSHVSHASHVSHYSGSRSSGSDSSDASDNSSTEYVAPVENTAPVAQDKIVSLEENSSLKITLEAQDQEKDNINYKIIHLPKHGTLKKITNGVYIYTPDKGFNGTDSLSYQADDGKLVSSVATVSISVEPLKGLPTITSTKFTTAKNEVLNFQISFSNNSNEVNLRLVDRPEHGTVKRDGNSLEYTPDKDFVGTDSFSVVVSDGENDSEPTQITIEVTEE